MGYKTSDNAEKEKLEKKGHKVIACIGVPFSGPIYVFDFDMTETIIEPTEKEQIAEILSEEKPKQRGNPNWKKGAKRK
jgi:hypothetical protein